MSQVARYTIRDIVMLKILFWTTQYSCAKFCIDIHPMNSNLQHDNIPNLKAVDIIAITSAFHFEAYFAGTKRLLPDEAHIVKGN